MGAMGGLAAAGAAVAGAASSGAMGGGSKIKQIPITLQNSLSGAQLSAQDKLMQLLMGQTPTYNGQLSAPLSGLQSSSLDALSGGVAGTQNAISGSGQNQSNAMGALNNILTSGPQNYQPYYQANVVQPLTQQFEQTTLPNVVSALGGSLGGPQSTAAVQGVTQAANNFENTLASANTSLAFNTAQQTAQNQLTAANEATTVSQAPINSLTSLLSAGGVPQATQQAADTAGYQNYLNQMGFTQNDINSLLAFLGTQTQTVANQNVVTPQSPNMLSGLLGGLGGSLGKSLPSLISALTSGKPSSLTGGTDPYLSGGDVNTGGWTDGTSGSW